VDNHFIVTVWAVGLITRVRRVDNGDVTDPQMMTLALAVIIPLSMLIYSNSRISEAKETLRAEMALLQMEIKAGFERLEAKLTVHELAHHRRQRRQRAAISFTSRPILG
jgi:hypothetical protein